MQTMGKASCLVSIILFTLTGAATAQEVTDMTLKDVSADELISALHIPTRQIGMKARCEPYQEKIASMSRGIGRAEVPALEPVKSVSVTANFQLNSDQLTPRAMKMLDSVAAALNSNQLATQCFQLAGHTCDLGGEGVNLELSQRRAAAVKAYLVGKGVEEDRLITTGYGESSPMVPNRDEQARRKNRRVDIGALAPVGLMD